MNLHVHIERLVLDEKVWPGEVHGLRRGLQRELTRLLRDGDLSHELHEGAALPSVRGGAIGQRTDRSAARFGSRVTHAVYEGIGARE